MIGNQVCAWFSDNGGAWTELGCRTDVTYTAGGHIGLVVNGTNGGVGVMDDFGGGNVAVSAARRGTMTGVYP